MAELPVSVGEYLRVEEASPLRHEYVAGQIFALTGGTRRHNQIGGNVYARLLAASRGGPCRVYFVDLKLRAADEVFYYPDVMVACGPEPSDPLIEDAPCLLVEVTSPGTEMIDRREKALVYKRIPSLRAYWVVRQDRRGVERHWRDGSGTWRYAGVSGEGRIACPCTGLELSLDEIYEGAEPPE